MYENRIKFAVDNFQKGFNCAQSVVLAFADIYGMTEDMALRASAAFGAGIGRMRETCGAVCGMTFLVGLDCGSTNPDDRQAKSACYKVVQDLADAFRQVNGSIICRELLQLSANAKISPNAEERTAEYYKKRPCVKMVETAAKIFADYLEEKTIK